ncbi:MAG TPA: 4-hydroxythreonine-4-phosphate dehydrogenase PdxA [Pseudolabrys sp.]|nr:4-hydroxythreonine-4-phosphate dehydrogenase PdxA [Pseudolabrys sp.]
MTAADALALTLGEPAGIGPDLTLSIWHQRRALAAPPFYVIGDIAFLGQRARQLGLDVSLAAVKPAEAAAVFPRALPVAPLDFAVTAAPGEPDGTSAPAAIGSIERAVADVMAGRASAVVTNPINKNVLYRAGFADPGHTEFLARLAQAATGRPAMPVMMLWAEELAVVPVTIHIPLREVMTRLSSALIVDTARIVARDMAARFGIARPRLALAGLNPHAGEDGSLGDEDERVVKPAVAQLRAEGIDARGPLPADTLFHARARANYDVALCMYHDQALIPIKTLAFDRGVNVTLGLPFIRTSPDHGTAFDITGTGRADPSSLLAALKLAARLSAHMPAPTAAP